ncbi:helix-turn-helix domain-containing protein [Ralstonia nicotianae]
MNEVSVTQHLHYAHVCVYLKALATQTSTIGSRLRAERKRLGHSQSQFAELAGVHKNAQGNYESDLRRPDADYLTQIAVIGVDVLYVLFGEPSSGSLLPDEQALLAAYRALDARGKAASIGAVVGLAHTEPTATPKQRISGRAQVITGGSNNVQIGGVPTKSPRTKSANK